ncbi:class I SAM-dependent methyltransferase [Paenibacillus marchantiae]|uniref:class I SAM-dependent methyltransferase n=1 Tax=Paenibacillus marchantiae TaxID=3026433 RepID=UPI00237A358D|nr:class I SAM-dependent methyltransferase [Paenibacillus marchantiae]WDQ33161.1 class I SAM-dependent methyltransferase [Paenibacillus marchantiae]
MSRVYNDNVRIDYQSLHEFYKKRAFNKVSIDVDAPVVLVGDRDKSKIEEWTNFEVEQRLPLLKLDTNSVVLEAGCGTGRITKYITPFAKAYVGVDYVKELIEIIKKRDDIQKKESTFFLHSSMQEIANGQIELPLKQKFNRFVISGGVLMYMNDEDVKYVLTDLSERLEQESIIYLSEPIAINERLTLNKFYSESLKSDYSAIYRTEKEYFELFDVFLENGFKMEVNEEFFFRDIKAQKETKQWIFVLRRV